MVLVLSPKVQQWYAKQMLYGREFHPPPSNSDMNCSLRRTRLLYSIQQSRCSFLSSSLTSHRATDILCNASAIALHKYLILFLWMLVYYFTAIIVWWENTLYQTWMGTLLIVYITFPISNIYRDIEFFVTVFWLVNSVK